MFTPDQNDGRHVFVFGSNLQGRHGKGAALEAVRHWGACRGVPSGRTGMAYAIPTKRTPWQTLALSEVIPHIDQFLDYARVHPNLTFLVTAVGCGLAGFTPQVIAPCFQPVPSNCVLPYEFRGVLR